MTSLAIILEFTRTHEPQDPYAFRFLPQDYTRRTTGGGVERIRIEWNDEFLADLTALRDPRHDPALVRKIGEQLRQALNAAAWSSIEKQISQADRDDQSIFVTIRSNAAELYALPWELTTIGDTGAHLGELRRTVLRYEWPETTTIQSSPSPRPAGGRMLLAWSAAEGAAVPAEKHLNAIACAYRD
ncbi:MAG: hypothetical protein KC420_03630, partial [Myxococcales bacterium]|nr:hypothetical protein [Myxococcales bacterium]